MAGVHVEATLYCLSARCALTRCGDTAHGQLRDNIHSHSLSLTLSAHEAPAQSPVVVCTVCQVYCLRCARARARECRKLRAERVAISKNKHTYACVRSRTGWRTFRQNDMWTPLIMCACLHFAPNRHWFVHSDALPTCDRSSLIRILPVYGSVFTELNTVTRC